MILLDTCAIIWDALEPDKLTADAKRAIKHAESELIICDISIWEISMLIKKKRLVIDAVAAGFVNLLLQSRNFHVQAITPEIASLSVDFGSEISSDPADRLIAATSIIMGAPIISADRNLRDATVVETIW